MLALNGTAPSWGWNHQNVSTGCPDGEMPSGLMALAAWAHAIGPRGPCQTAPAAAAEVLPQLVLVIAARLTTCLSHLEGTQTTAAPSHGRRRFHYFAAIGSSSSMSLTLGIFLISSRAVFQAR